MSEKRRDKRNRVLRDGESQREDGRYIYKYRDYDGKWCYVYSWRLDVRDPLPAGKRKDLSLREKEKAINEKLNKDIIAHESSLQVIEIIDRYLSVKEDIKETTKTVYKTIRKLIEKYPFASYPIDKVKITEAKMFIIQLKKDGYSYSYINNVFAILKPAFEQAVQDDLLLKNPFAFRLCKVIKNDRVKKGTLTQEQEASLLEFTRASKYKRVYPVMYILFHTGMRISEYCGLTLSDLDFKKKRITIDHQMLKVNNARHITSPKSKNGIRTIPMTDEVAECFKEILRRREQSVRKYGEPIIDGYAGFLHVSQGMVATAYHWEKMFRKVCDLYNKEHPNSQIYITPHGCRHTFCTKMVRNGMNPKSLQYIMGHGRVEFTMQEYTHFDFTTAERDFRAAIGA